NGRSHHRAILQIVRSNAAHGHYAHEHSQTWQQQCGHRTYALRFAQQTQSKRTRTSKGRCDYLCIRRRGNECKRVCVPILTMYEHTYPEKRFSHTMAFVKKHVSPNEKILDLGVP